MCKRAWSWQIALRAPYKTVLDASPALKAVKNALQSLHYVEKFTDRFIMQLPTSPIDNSKIQKVVNGMATKMLNQNQYGCYYIQAINEYIATGTN